MSFAYSKNCDSTKKKSWKSFLIKTGPVFKSSIKASALQYVVVIKIVYNFLQTNPF